MMGLFCACKTLTRAIELSKVAMFTVKGEIIENIKNKALD
ncbi:hypothetical protein CPS_3561 [Colwellia psychrerythraea 34H]|uniref:Uncharacterized protein n=1 Tax=Colwellia psychrerythraea (strain 34H / ATCC BAA-681) TaxID=167879 RepID=Q47Y85_COLP3|nr:hypothetical protein CPS_3561 [Colwellia psychrerythraea 34H]